MLASWWHQNLHKRCIMVENTGDRGCRAESKTTQCVRSGMMMPMRTMRTSSKAMLWNKVNIFRQDTVKHLRWNCYTQRKTAHSSFRRRRKSFGGLLRGTANMKIKEDGEQSWERWPASDLARESRRNIPHFLEGIRRNEKSHSKVQKVTPLFTTKLS